MATATIAQRVAKFAEAAEVVILVADCEEARRIAFAIEWTFAWHQREGRRAKLVAKCGRQGVLMHAKVAIAIAVTRVGAALHKWEP